MFSKWFFRFVWMWQIAWKAERADFWVLRTLYTYNENDISTMLIILWVEWMFLVDIETRDESIGNSWCIYLSIKQAWLIILF